MAKEIARKVPLVDLSKPMPKPSAAKLSGAADPSLEA
jgi:hypothetical protein